jgi:cytoskeletal protein CcmA (bactofilin family)
MVFKEEKGAVLPFALIILMVGLLVVIPLLNLGSTALINSEVYEDRLLQVYAADAGVEWAMWHISSKTTTVPVGGEVTLSEFQLNGLPVNVTISDLGERRYRITSSSGNPGSITVIEADTCVEAMPDGYTLIEGDKMFAAGFTSDDDYYITGDVTLSGGCQLGGDVFSDGDVTIIGNSNVIQGNVLALGDILFSGDTAVHGSVAAGGNLTMQSDSVVHGDAYVQGNLQMLGQSEIKGNVYIGGGISLGGGADIFGSYPLPYEEPPFAFQGVTAIFSWDIQYN